MPTQCDADVAGRDVGASEVSISHEVEVAIASPASATAARPADGQRLPVLRWLDAFLQEQNIKWILGIGALILVGSSLKLVGTLWHDSSPAFKHLILLAYTTIVWEAASFSYWRLGLRKTGTVLKALTVLLIPISFLGLHWVLRESADGPIELVRNLGLLTLNVGLAWCAARPIFTHFLRAQQPTFLFSYLVLCLAGAIVPALPANLWPLTTFVLWAVFSAGVVKVNRHVFWMTEDRRLPRICGFFPILLLGGQFVTLFAAYVLPHVPVDWLGLACVLTAMPVLLTADAVARVFQQRARTFGREAASLSVGAADTLAPPRFPRERQEERSDFVEQARASWPWSVLLPLLTGLVLCLAGVGLAATGLPFPRALVPTAAIAAFLMAVVARRTGRSGFVWAMLVGLTLSYNFSYVFFRELAAMLIHSGAVAVHEQRLPLAFYGLTYLPLLAVMTCGTAWLERRGKRRALLDAIDLAPLELFLGPTRQFVAGLCALLLAAAFTHAKALFPVAACMTAMFGLQTGLFRDRRRLFPAGLAWVASAWGLSAFVETVLLWPASADLPFYAMIAAATGLLFPGALVDRWAARLARRSDDARLAASNTDTHPTAILQSTSLALTCAIAAFRIAQIGWSGVEFCACDVLISVLVAIQALVWLRQEISIAAVGYLFVLPIMHACVQPVAWQPIVEGTGWGMLGLWILAHALARRPEWRVSRAFGWASAWVSSRALGLLLPFYIVGSLLLAQVPGAVDVPWWLTGATLAWGLGAARFGSGFTAGMSNVPPRDSLCPPLQREGDPFAGFVACLGLLALAGAAWSQIFAARVSGNWLPTVWAGAAFVALPLVLWMRRSIDRWERAQAILEPEGAVSSPWRSIAIPAQIVMLGCLMLVSAVSLVQLALAWRVAAGVSLAGLAWFVTSRGNSESRQGVGLLANWQLLVQVVALATIGGQIPSWIGDLGDLQLAAALGPVACIAALSVLVWRRVCGIAATADDRTLPALHCTLLQLVTAVAIAARMLIGPAGLGVIEGCLILAAFVATAADLLLVACHLVDETRVWVAQIVAGAAVLFFWWFGVIHPGTGLGMYVVLASAGVFRAIGRLSAGEPRTAILSRPFSTSGLALPLVAVVLGIVRHISGAESAWLGLNSLALLLAAAFYFWRGLESRGNQWIVLSIAILNAALALLWRELAWSDPQFFMIPLGLSIIGLVELLRREIPPELLNPLRYAGALIVLVSPTFHIVEGSWLHLTTLMMASVAIVLLAVAIRVRAVMYTGVAFLLADLVAMVVRSSVDRPNVLWIAGIGIGSLVIALGAVCENHREALLQRLRMLSAELEAWR